MHFIAESAVLSRALTACREVSDQKSTIAVIASAKLSLNGNTLSLEATDLSMKFATSIEVQGRADGVAILSAQRLLNIVKSFPDGSQLEIAPSTPEGAETIRYTLRSGRSRYQLPAIDPKAWVVFPDIEAGLSFMIASTDLRRLLATTAPFTISDGGLSALWGHYLHRDKDRLVAVGCNKHILCAASISAPEGTGDLYGVVIPPHTARRAAALTVGDVNITVSETLISFAWGSSILVSKMIEEAYPDYQRLIPNNPNKINLEAQDTKRAIKCAAMISDDVTVGGSRSVRLTASQEFITISAAGANGEEGEEVVEALCAQEGSWGFNSRYLVTILDACGDDTVTAWFADATDPVLLSPDGDPGLTLVAMPMSLKARQ